MPEVKNENFRLVNDLATTGLYMSKSPIGLRFRSDTTDNHEHIVALLRWNNLGNNTKDVSGCYHLFTQADSYEISD